MGTVIVEVGCIVVAMMVGAVIGMLIPLKGEAAVTNVVVCAFLASVIWKRRQSPWATTLGLCLGLLVICWPIVFVFLDWLHQYY